jgi:hypothetical protein
MNKFIRFSIFLIFIIAGMVLVLAFIEPNDVTVSRSILIKAPKESIFEQIVTFQKWEKWSTLFSNDSSVKLSYNGASGQAGSSLEWKGDEGSTGEGIIKNNGIDGSSMRYSFTVTKPAELLADGIISAKDTGEYTKVTWTFHKHFPFLANAILVVFDLDKYMGGDFERSLANLKKYVESEIEPLIDITEVAYTGGVIAGIRDTVEWNEMETFFGDTYSLFIKTPTEKITGEHLGIYYDRDTVKRRADVMAGLQVADSSIPVNGITYIDISESRAFKATFKGCYSGATRVHNALTKHISARGMTKWLSIEEYKIYPGNESDSSKWVTNIYVLVQ